MSDKAAEAALFLRRYSAARRALTRSHSTNPSDALTHGSPACHSLCPQPRFRERVNDAATLTILSYPRQSYDRLAAYIPL